MSSEMNTADCKKIITNMMKSLIDALTSSEIGEYYAKTDHDLHQLMDAKQWKRRSKSGGPGNVTRTFEHEHIDATIVLQEVPTKDGEIALEVNMTELPQCMQDATTRVESMDLQGRPAKRQDPKPPSMTEGPKPEGFGAFA